MRCLTISFTRHVAVERRGRRFVGTSQSLEFPTFQRELKSPNKPSTPDQGRSLESRRKIGTLILLGTTAAVEGRSIDQREDGSTVADWAGHRLA